MLWSLRAAKRKGDDLWEIKKYKGTHTCMNSLTSRGHRQFDVRYKSALIRLLAKAALFISVAAIQATATQITEDLVTL